MTNPNGYRLPNMPERLAYAVALLGATAVAAATGTAAETASAGHRQAGQGPRISKPAHAQQGISTAIAIGISGNRPVK